MKYFVNELDSELALFKVWTNIERSGGMKCFIVNDEQDTVLGFIKAPSFGWVHDILDEMGHENVVIQELDEEEYQEMKQVVLEAYHS